MLLLVTFRSEFEPPWIGRAHVTALTINRLTDRQIGAMIDRVVGNKILPASVRQDIAERTDGIPLFVEEMTKAVLEAGSENAAEQTAAAVPSTIPVPASLHASLMAQLDRLGPAKEVAQIGAAIGRDALIQDAAYGTLLRSRRQRLHGEITSTIEEAFPEIAETQPAILARHCAEADWTRKPKNTGARPGKWQYVGRAIVRPLGISGRLWP
jgi:predicted ATPase